MSNKKLLSQLEKLLDSQASILKQLGRWLTTRLSYATEHLPDKEKSIYTVFKHCVVTVFLLKKNRLFRNRISSMLGSLPKSKWMTFLDNLSISKDPSILHIQLLQIFLQESTLREKVFRPFWTPAYKELSERLLLPTETDCVGLASNLSNSWSLKQEDKSQFLTVQTTRLQNRNSQKTFSQSFMSSLVDKWEKEAIATAKLKTLKIKVYPTQNQKKIIDGFINTSRYVYNKTVCYIKKGHKANFQSLRDLLVTEKTKKRSPEYQCFDDKINILKSQKKTSVNKKLIDDEIKLLQKQRRDLMKNFQYEKNPLIQNFETSTPKEIRASAVKRCCDAHKTGFSNLKNGNIRFFNMKFKKKTDKDQSIEIPPSGMSIKDCKIKIYPTFFADECYLSVHNKKQLKDIQISHNVDLLKRDKEYFICIPIRVESRKSKLTKISGVDLGIRTFATVHTHDKDSTIITEYKHRSDLLKKYNCKIKLLKSLSHIRKKHFTKLEKKKKNLVDCLHWSFINDLLENSDVVYLGDIKSHDIVKNGKNKSLNLSFNDLKMFILKQRLIYKAGTLGKPVYLVPEHFTTKTCSSCGNINQYVGSSEIFTCSTCNLIAGRDVNAAKNIKMKGLLL